MKEYYNAIIKEVLKKAKNIDDVIKIRDNLSKKYKPSKWPSIVQIFLAANKKDRAKLFKLLKSKPSRASSGVAVVAVMSKPGKCPGECIYCPKGENSPQSYTGKEPATLRAIRNKYNPYLQIFNRLEQYLLLGVIPSKVELIIMGGTFPSYSLKYQNNFIRLCLQAMNDFSIFLKQDNFEKFIKFFELDYENLMDKKKINKINKKILSLIKKKSFEKVKKENEKARIRCVAMVIETRPDYCNEKEVKRMLNQGVTRVELGVQSLDDKILKKINRKHDVKQVVKATKLLKNNFLKVGYHYMIGLYGSSKENDINNFRKMFSDARFRPDGLKIYPCMVFKGTKLYNLWRAGKYKPITTREASELIMELKKYIPRYCRVMRIQRDIPSEYSEAGVDRTNLRQYVHELMNGKGIKCGCIRCRQIRGKVKGKVRLNKIEYIASEAKEIFLSYETKNQLIGFLRLRLGKEAGIRELHVYSTMLEIGKKSEESYQHKGYGIKLLKEAERITKENNYKKLYIISGIGVKEYYRKFGYKDDKEYMVKLLN